MEEFFEKSMEQYNQYVIKYGKRPKEVVWNQLAKKEDLLCSLSMKYIGKVKFRK